MSRLIVLLTLSGAKRDSASVALGAVAVICCGVVIPARAQSFAPIARASADRAEVLVGESVQLFGSDSVDPDAAPGPLTYGWDFGDGGTSTDADPVHVYPARGAYIATLTVDDGAQ